uniref:Small ribosomal subunit protein uS3c n=1 Tax=Monomorphina aenigmatica TaxID=304863 RepID=L0BIH4_MONAE|nr:ribosomal protein S3 [Monomorphina aenigmatica]AFZ88811.1 ribosomal protein S3 [Monomorphina aenigmatica]
MGQKVHPVGFRIGISKPHASYWYSNAKDYLSFLHEDIFIRDFVNKNFLEAGISHIEIKRKLNFISLDIFVAKPSLIIGVNGNSLFEFRRNLTNQLATKFQSRDVTINLVEIVNPDLNAKFLAEFIRQQLEKRVPFRRIMKTAILKAQKVGVKGIKVQIAGRLNGAEIARTEWIREGQVPLHNLKANIDYCSYKAQTLYGILGIKVWIYVS